MPGARLPARRRAVSRWIAAVVAGIALIAGLLVAVPTAVAAPVTYAKSAHVPTADLTKFQPGNIISDATFFDRGTMTEAQIQSFLEARVPNCQSGYTCLKDWYDTSRTTTADAMCGAYSGGVRERASRIIYKVAQACGINPQVILATLEKEQGLVRHTWPSEWRYTIAMGQGCPDTAACDTRYYGFFNQVYGAAWQFKRYANPAGTSQYFTWYAPGKTWNVRYNPNASCGSSPVYIQNQATANLYYYTPYQPNAAALRAGYGTGDGCSAYGNRNFYNFFTDWFGSTQAMTPVLAQYGNPVYLVTGTSRYLITKEDFPEFREAFGSPVPVTLDFVNRLAHRGNASLFLRNSATGSVALLQSGKRYVFGSCAQVSAWGSSCGAETSIDSAVYSRVPSGGAVSAFAAVGSPAVTHILEGTVLRPVYDSVTATLLNGGREPFVGNMKADVASRYSRGLVRFATAHFLRTENSGSVRLPTTDGRLLGLANWAHAAEFGLPGTTYRVNVPNQAVVGYDQSGSLSLFVRCNERTFFAASGVLNPVEPSAASGFTVTTLDGPTCDQLVVADTVPAPRVFVQAAGSNGVYLAVDGVLRLFPSRDLLTALNGGVWPRVLTVSAATRSSLPQGPVVSWSEAWPVIGTATGSLVRASDGVAVSLVDNGRGFTLPNWAVGDELGVSNRLRVVSPQVMSALSVQADPLRPMVRCEGRNWVASAGVLYSVSDAARAGVPATELAAETCGTLNRSGGDVGARLFVSVSGQTYLAENGVFRPLAASESPRQLNGGVEPLVIPWAAGALAAMSR